VVLKETTNTINSGSHNKRGVELIAGVA